MSEKSTKFFQNFHFPIYIDRQIFQSYILSASNYRDPKVPVPYFVSNKKYILLSV